MTPLAVLFDFDGVLADTANVHIAAWERTFARMGWDVTPEECAPASEVDDRAFLESIFATRGLGDGGDLAGWVRHKQDATLELLADAPRLYPGVPELLDWLRGRARLAIITTTTRANVQTILKPSSLLDAFELVIAKEDVKALKPAPEGYLQALRRLKVAAGQAVALEDSPTGLTAAAGAKLRCLALGHRRTDGPWVGHASFLPNLSDRLATLRALGFADAR